MRVPVLITVFAVCATGVLAGCGSSGGGTGAGASQPTTTTAVTPGATTITSTVSEPEITACLEGGQPKSTKPSYPKAEQVLTAGTDYAIVMKTSCGTIRIALDPKAGGPIPNSVAFLVTKGFYDGLTFHRVVPDFVLQGGDPEGTGGGGPGYSVVGPVPSGYQYKLGDVAMAKTGAEPGGTAGSQFFVVTSDAGGAGLTPDYGILGHATDATSLATIKRIADLAVSDGPPSKPVWIISAKLVPAA